MTSALATATAITARRPCCIRASLEWDLWDSSDLWDSPDDDLLLQLHARALPHATAHQVDQPEHVAGGCAGVGDDVVGVPFAHLRTADLLAGQSRLLQQRLGAETLRVLEHAGGRLEAERLRRLPLDPGFAHPFDDRV